MNYDFPSFFRDLPTTAKPLPQNNLADKISWASNEDVNIELVDDMSDQEPENPVVSKLPLSTDNIMLSKVNQNVEMLPITIDNHELGKQLQVLSEMTTSVEAQKKFAQAMLILDSLQIGINDLEKIATDNSELIHVLKKQKNTINDVLNEVKFGMSRSLERVATNVYNKVQTMGRRFEQKWCKLEQLNGLFYGCEEFRNRYKIKNAGNKKQLEKTKAKTDFSKQQHNKKKVIMESYKYKVDKDSTGKVHSKEKSGNGDYNDYYKIVKKENINKYKIKQKLQDPIHYKINSHKFKNNNKKIRKMDHLKQPPENKIKKENRTTQSDDRNFQHSKGEPLVKKSIEEVVSKILKEMCIQNKKGQKQSNKSGDYLKLKEEVDKKLKIPKELFEKIYMKFCVYNSDTVNKEYSKQVYKNNIFNNDNIIDSNLIIETPSTINILNVKISSSPEISCQDVKRVSDSVKDKVIEPVNQNEWTLSYEICPPVNKTNGEWFLKYGEYRSQVRWFHQRSDWWFDRSSHRRHYQYNYPHPSNWFVDRRKNWFFRRAWARQNCKDSPYNNWCHLDDDTVTIPNSNFS